MTRLALLLYAIILPAIAQAQTGVVTFDSVAALKARTDWPESIVIRDGNPGFFKRTAGACSAADDVFQIQPTSGPAVCYIRQAGTPAPGNSATTNGVWTTNGSGVSTATTTLPNGLHFGDALFTRLTDIASWPESFGATPTSIASINHNDYPTSGMIPAGTLHQYTAAMIVPSRYTQQPWPNVNYAAYIENQGTSGQSAVNYFGVATLSATRTYGGSFNGVISNTDAAYVFRGSGRGRDFTQLVGLEVNPNVWKKGAAPPAGSVDGIRYIGGGDDTRPVGGAFANHYFPLAGYGGRSPTWWTSLNYSEDGAASTPENESSFANIGVSGSGNELHSQSLTARARRADGMTIGGHLRYAATANWHMTGGLVVGADIGKGPDAGALLQTYASANRLVISGVLRNENGGAGTAVALGFNTTTASSRETSVSKGGIGFTRSGPQGIGYGSLYNRARPDANPFGSSDEALRWTGSGVQAFGTFAVGPALPALATGEVGLNKIAASGTAPGAGTGKLALVAGTNAGTCKLVLYAGSSGTPTTIVDNVGSGC